MARELRSLRASAACSMVSQVLVTPEGREGLVRALAAALGAQGGGGDPGLAAQLRVTLASIGHM